MESSTRKRSRSQGEGSEQPSPKRNKGQEETDDIGDAVPLQSKPKGRKTPTRKKKQPTHNENVGDSETPGPFADVRMPINYTHFSE